jgi:hypothetical protein
MTTLASLFSGLYRTGRDDFDFSAIRLHYVGADRICRALSARALTVGSDIYFRDGAFAPHTREGLRLLAHEVAHVVQQRRGPVTAIGAPGGLATAPDEAPEEREADAAADALLAGRPFDFTRPGYDSTGKPGPVVQRYMAWEHCLLGDLDPVSLYQAASGREAGHVEALCALLEQLG